MIYVLDTNVLSELMKPRPAQAVLSWLIRHGTDDLRTAAVCQAEILAGAAILPESQRRRDLEAATARVFAQTFARTVLPFDSGAARHFADIVAARQRSGRPILPLDAMIAAIARTHGAAVATRDVADFQGCGVVVHNPWRED